MRRERWKALTRFESVALEEHWSMDTDEYVRSVLRKALGEDKANLLLDRILQGSDVSSIESLKWMDAAFGGRADPQRTPADHCHHPGPPGSRPIQLGARSSASVNRNEAVIRIATLDGIQPTALKRPQRGDEPDSGRRASA